MKKGHEKKINDSIKEIAKKKKKKKQRHATSQGVSQEDKLFQQ